MKGKIFEGSTGIDQDLAKIIFNYYQDAAEKIVSEEERIEQEISILEANVQIITTSIERVKLWKWVLCVFIFTYVYFKIKENNLIKEAKELKDRILEYHKLHDEIFRDYKISKLGVAYVPIANQLKYDNKSFIVDYTGIQSEIDIELRLLRNTDLLLKTLGDIDRLSSEAPYVEDSLDVEEIDTFQYSKSIQHINHNDYFGNFDRSLRTISFCLSDLEVSSVTLPLVSVDSNYSHFISEYTVRSLPDGAVVINVFDNNKYNDQVAKFQELNKLKDSLSKNTKQFEDILKGLITKIADSVQAISLLKVSSSDKMIFESNKVLYKILKSPYNHYSPVLESSEIERIKNEDFNYGDTVQDYLPFQLKESSKVRYNLFENVWTAEDGSVTNFPFGIHQIQEEIVAPIVQNLLKDNKVERLKIYNHIKDQKIEYLNKWHQDTEDFYGRNRSESADLINLMRESLRDYVAACNSLSSLKKTEESMTLSKGELDSTVVAVADNSSEVLIAFELQSKDFKSIQDDFEQYMDRLKDDIDVKALKFEHIDYYDALLRDGNSKETALAASEVHELDHRRKSLVSVNPLFAKESELPPVPSYEDLISEHISINLPSIAKNTLLEIININPF